MLVKEVLEAGGDIAPLIIPEGREGGLMNPSIYNDNGKLLCNLRHVKYTIYHNRKHPHTYGPLQYIHREDDRTLRTVNYIVELSDDLRITSTHKVDTSQLDVTPLWEFIGLEDARLFRWNGVLCLCGVRRDTTTNGQGRMEISELGENYKETYRRRIPAPGNDDSYCEKNWMPILDQPHKFVKWTNPTEVADTSGTKTISEVKNNYRYTDRDLRGSSQVIPYKGKYIAFLHECALYKSELLAKDAVYLHRLVVWDKDWNIEYLSEPFSFTGAPIEFCTGLAEYKDSFLVSFGVQDNAAFILKIPARKFQQLCNF